MKILDVLLASRAIEIFGWALLHSLWQGIILAVLLKAVINLSRKVSANTRYLTACLTLLLMLLLPVSTALLSNSGKRPIDFSSIGLQTTDSNNKSITLSDKTALQSNISETEFPYKLWIYRAEKQFLPWVVLTWLIGVFICSLRLAGVWTYTQRLKLSEKHLVLEQWSATLQRLCRQLRVSRPVVLLESSLVRVPTVIGWLKPVILIPPCALTGLTPQQFELILAHELAHVRRHDYLVNLLQTIIETILFYHPAAWWVSSQIRSERENACDDLAVTVGGDAVVYARTLIEMERVRKAAPSLAMAADGGSLTTRIHRLIGAEMLGSKRSAGLWMVIFISLFVITTGATIQNSSVNKEPSKERTVNKSFLNLPSLTIEDLREGAQAAQNVMTGEWTAEFNQNKLGEVRLEIQKRSKRKGINGSINTLSVSELQDLAPEAASSAKTDVAFSVEREAGTFVFEGYFSNGRGRGFWTLAPNQNFVSDMRSRGYDNLPENYLFYAATENVTAKLVDDMDAAGQGLSFKELIQAASYQIRPETFQAWRAAGFNNLSFDDLVKLGEHDVTLEYLNEIRAEGFTKISLRQAVKLKDNDIDQDFIRRVKTSGFPNVTLDDLIDFRINDTTK